MDDCQIPENISRRAQELNILSEKLDKINEDFIQFKEAHLNTEA